MKKIIIGLFIALIITVGAVIIQGKMIQTQRAQVVRLKINLAAARDSIRISVDRNGDSQFNKLTYVVDKLSELEKLNKDLATEVQATKGKVVQITKTGVKVVHDTITLRDSVDSTGGNMVVRFNEDTTYSPGNARKLSGTTTISDAGASTDITRDEIYFTATTGLVKQSNGDYEIFFRSQYPGLTLTDLDGAYIPKNQLITKPKKKRWEFGIQAGYNPLVYDLTHHTFSIENQLSAGLGVQFKF